MNAGCVGQNQLRMYHMANTKKIRSKHNNLLNYFIHDKRDLSKAYIDKCEKFFNSICWPSYYGGGPDLNHQIFKLKKPK